MVVLVVAGRERRGLVLWASAKREWEFFFF